MGCWKRLLFATDIARASNLKSTSSGRFSASVSGGMMGNAETLKRWRESQYKEGKKAKLLIHKTTSHEVGWFECRSSWGWNFPLRLGVSLFSQTARQPPLQVCRNIPAHVHAYIFAYVHLFFLYLLFYSVFPSTSHGTFRAWMHRVSKSGHSCWIFSSHLSPSLPSPTLNSPDRPPSSFSYSASSSSSFPPSFALSSSATATALCSPLSLRGSPLIALHITLNHHNNKSTLSQKKTHLEGMVLKDPTLTDVIKCWGSWLARAERESPPQVFDAGFGESAQVGQVKDIPLMENSRENTQKLAPGSSRRAVFSFTVKRQMNKTTE